MSSYQVIVTGYILLINTAAYAIMWLDKLRSKQKGTRVSENNLFMLALALGACGIYLGMKAPLYHKSAKTKFKIGIPLLLLINAGMICYLFCLIPA